MPGFLDSSTQISVTVNGDTFKVWDEWQQGQTREVFSINPQEAYATTVWLCDWSQRQQLAIAMIGNTIQVAGTPNYKLGAPYPDFPAYQCNRVEISSDGNASIGPNGIVAFERARLKGRWQIPQYIPGDPVALGELELNFSSTMFALDQASASFSWGSGQPLPPSAIPALKVTTCLMSVARYQQPSINTSQIFGAIDMTNAASFYGAATETAIYRGCKSSKSLTPAGGLNYTILHMVEVMGTTGATWNKLPKPGSVPLWQPYYLSDGTTKPFPTTDLSFVYT